MKSEKFKVVCCKCNDPAEAKYSVEQNCGDEYCSCGAAEAYFLCEKCEEFQTIEPEED